MGLFDLLSSSSADALEHVIAFANERHKVLANNVANIDTPGYRMHDLAVDDFDATLSKAIARGKKTNPALPRLDLPTPAEVDRAGSTRGPDAAKLRGIVFHDDNDRSIERLAITMTKNAQRQIHAVSLLRNQLQLLKSIIAESAA